MYTILQHAHSGLRWIVLLVLIVIIANAIAGLSQNRAFSVKDGKLVSAGTGIVHLQFLLGLILFFVSPRVQFSSETMSNGLLRFFTVEHTVMMLIAVALVTIGSRKSRKAVSDKGRFSNILWWFLAGLVIMLAAIPWPFRESLGGSWF